MNNRIDLCGPLRDIWDFWIWCDDNRVAMVSYIEYSEIRIYTGRRVTAESCRRLRGASSLYGNVRVIILMKDEIALTLAKITFANIVFE